MGVFQNEIFGPVLCVTTFKTEAEAIALANDTTYGLGAGVWTRDVNRQHRVGRALKSGRVWMNCYHHYPAGGCLCCSAASAAAALLAARLTHTHPAAPLHRRDFRRLQGVRHRPRDAQSRAVGVPTGEMPPDVLFFQRTGLLLSTDAQGHGHARQRSATERTVTRPHTDGHARDPLQQQLCGATSSSFGAQSRLNCVCKRGAVA